MSNTINGINLAQIAQESLDVLQPIPFMLDSVSKNFSSETLGAGQTSITTRYVVAPTAQDITSGYAPTAISTVSRTMSFTNFWGFVVGLTDSEVMNAAVNIQNLFTQPAAITTVNKAENLVMSLITNSNYSAKVTKTSAQFDSDVVADLADTLSTANVIGPRTLVLSPTYYASLLKDTSVKSALAFGEGAPLPTGVVGRLHGMNIIVNTNIPNNSENLVGFALAPQAICVAARGITTPQNFPGLIENTVDARTGLPMQWRYWYNPDAASQDGSHNFSVATNFAYQVGVPANLVRIVSA